MALALLSTIFCVPWKCRLFPVLVLGSPLCLWEQWDMLLCQMCPATPVQLLKPWLSHTAFPGWESARGEGCCKFQGKVCPG